MLLQKPMQPKTTPKKDTSRKILRTKKLPLAPIQGLRLETPINQLFEISDTLKKLNESELLTLARNYNNDFNFSIFKWENLQYRLLLSNSDDTAWADWDVVSSDTKREKSNLLDLLTIDDIIKLAKYEYPEWDKVESMIEKSKINIPSFSQKYRIIDASILIEIVILISIIYFWVFLVEAILSSNYPETGTFFNAISRTTISKFYFFCLLLFPAVISVLVGIKSIEYNKLNIICGIITLIFVTKIWANIFKTKQD